METQTRITAEYKHRDAHCPEDDFDMDGYADNAHDIFTFFKRIDTQIATRHSGPCGYLNPAHVDFFEQDYFVHEGQRYNKQCREIAPPAYYHEAVDKFTVFIERAKRTLSRIKAIREASREE